MESLSRAALDLVTAATSDVEPRALRRVVEKVLTAFERAPKPERDAAVRTMGDALGRAEGRGAQVLCLALGALVEGGASPELAWRAVGRGLHALLDDATAFASAAVEEAGDPHLDSAIEAVGSTVAKEKPGEARAWDALPSRCLAAIACLTRSKKLRARRDEALLDATWALSEAVPEVGHLRQALRIVDDEELVVLAPELARGWRVAIDAMTTTTELYVLLGDALAGESAGEGIPGKAPDPRAVAYVRDGTAPKGRVRAVSLPFQLLAPTAVTRDGWLDRGAPEDELPPGGDLADVLGPGDEYVALLRLTPTRNIPLSHAFEGVRPSLDIVEVLSPAEVDRRMKKLTRSARRATAKRSSRKA